MEHEIDLNVVVQSLSSKLAQSEVDNSYKDALIESLKKELEETRREVLEDMNKE